MEYKNKLNQIKALLSLEVKLAQMKLQDGITVVEAESFEPDYSIGIVTPDGIVPMPVGEYTLEDGTVLVVEVEGVIKSIAPQAQEEVMPEADHPAAEATEPQMAAEPAAPQPKRVVESVSKETFFESQVEELKAEIEALKAENEALKLSAQVQEEEVKLSQEEEGAEPIAFNPESAIKPQGFKIGSKSGASIEQSVYNKLFN